MTKTKLYVLLFDNFVYEGVFNSFNLASSYRQMTIHNVEEVIVEGDITNNNVYVVLENGYIFCWLFAQENQAIGTCNEFGYTYKKVNIVSNNAWHPISFVVFYI